jgi:ribonuclease Y
MDIVTIVISGIIGIAAGFGIAKIIEKTIFLILLKTQKKKPSILKPRS